MVLSELVPTGIRTIALTLVECVIMCYREIKIQKTNTDTSQCDLGGGGNNFIRCASISILQWKISSLLEKYQTFCPLLPLAVHQLVAWAIKRQLYTLSIHKWCILAPLCSNIMYHCEFWSKSGTTLSLEVTRCCACFVWHKTVKETTFQFGIVSFIVDILVKIIT